MTAKKKTATKPATPADPVFVVAVNQGDQPVIVYAGASQALAQAWQAGFNFAQGQHDSSIKWMDEETVALLLDDVKKHPKAYTIEV